MDLDASLFYFLSSRPFFSIMDTLMYSSFYETPNCKYCNGHINEHICLRTLPWCTEWTLLYISISMFPLFVLYWELVSGINCQATLKCSFSIYWSLPVSKPNTRRIVM